jgi:RNA-splicing ligase RtcB
MAGKYKIFAKTFDETTIKQIDLLMNSPLGTNAHTRIMPDCHAGKGCVIGTSMLVNNKICPNIVGVDIACGVTLMHTNIDFKSNLEQLDANIHRLVPSGKEVHKTESFFPQLFELKCWNKLDAEQRKRAFKSLGSLGGGNHFIEAYEDGYLCVHSGSRNIGKCVAEYYQDLAIQKLQEKTFKERMEVLSKTKLEDLKKEEIANYYNKVREIRRSCVITQNEADLAYLEGQDMLDYLHDSFILNEYALASRTKMLEIINNSLNGSSDYTIINSTHNFIEKNADKLILRKGATPAYKGQTVLIPLNMHDGLLICEGKGNPDWNYTAPHGAGRLYSRSQAFKDFTLEEYQHSMQGIFSTCITKATIDEAPFVYKNYEEIMSAIQPTVTIIKRLIPIYNFKAVEERKF